jgi:hypothetical protein
MTPGAPIKATAWADMGYLSDNAPALGGCGGHGQVVGPGSDSGDATGAAAA